MARELEMRALLFAVVLAGCSPALISAGPARKESDRWVVPISVRRTTVYGVYYDPCSNPFVETRTGDRWVPAPVLKPGWGDICLRWSSLPRRTVHYDHYLDADTPPGEYRFAMNVTLSWGLELVAYSPPFRIGN
jgi:hypothetical protein